MIRVEVSHATQSHRIVFEDGSAINVSRQQVWLATARKAEALSGRFVTAFAEETGFAMVSKEKSGWPFTAPANPGDLLAAPKPALFAARARRLKAAKIEFLPTAPEALQLVQMDLKRFLVSDDSNGTIEVDCHGQTNKNLIFMTSKSLGQPNQILKQQLVALKTLAARHPDMRVVFPASDRETLRSTSMDKLEERILMQLKEHAINQTDEREPISKPKSRAEHADIVTGNQPQDFAPADQEIQSEPDVEQPDAEWDGPSM